MVNSGDEPFRTDNMNALPESTPCSCKIMVSILAAAYNHENYIAHALDSFIMQKTDFPIEIIVQDDASSDRTAEIIKQYEKRYPSLIKPIYQNVNQFSQGKRPILLLAKKARGKYLAICECDDYWTDPLKLQKQVNLLEAHPECSMAVAKTDVHHFEDGQFYYQETYEGIEKDFLYFDDFIKGCYLHTSTYVIPRKFFAHVEKYIGIAGDTGMRFILLDIGPFAFLREIVSVYRITGTGVWTNRNSYEQATAHIILYESLYRDFKPKYKKYWAKILMSYYISIIAEDIRKRRSGTLFRNGVRLSYLVLRYAPIYALNKLAISLFRYIKLKTNKVTI